ncbi:MAG: ureidoglycolate lyase, partial [Sphingomonadales bacterium]
DGLATADVADGDGAAAISIFRARPLAALELRTFERHPLGSQAFMPLSGRPYLVAVAPAGPFDPAAIRVFRASAQQGVQYARGVWHHFLLVLDAESDFLVIDRTGPGDNCDEVALAPEAWIRVLV